MDDENQHQLDALLQMAAHHISDALEQPTGPQQPAMPAPAPGLEAATEVSLHGINLGGGDDIVQHLTERLTTHTTTGRALRAATPGFERGAGGY